MKTKTIWIINILLSIILLVVGSANIISIIKYIITQGFNLYSISIVIYCILAIPIGIYGFVVSVKGLNKKEDETNE